MTKVILLLSIFFFSLFVAKAQKEGQPLADSLELVISGKNISETERVNVLTKLAYEYRNLLPRKAIAFGEQAEQLAKEIHYEKKMGEIYMCRSMAYSFFNDIIKSYEFALLGLKYNTDNQITDLIPFSKMLVLTLNPNSTNETVSNSIHKILSEVTHIKDKIWYIRTIGGFGNSFRAYRIDAIKADSLINLAIEESKKANQKFLEMHNLGRVAGLYFLNKNYDAAIYFNRKIITYLESIGEKRIYSECLAELAEIYLIKFKSSLKSMYLDSAQIFSDLALQTCFKIEYATLILSGYNLQYRISKERGDSKKAMNYLEKYNLLNDSLYGKNVRSKLEGIAIKQRDEIADAQLKIKDNEVAKQKLIRNVSFVGVLLILFASVIIYRNLIKQHALNNKLKQTQKQLIESERMAALGSVATRMAHEIQNPLNFVNNFSELSNELIDEIILSKTEEEKNDAANILKENLEKINHHGKRASAIIIELQERSRKGIAHEFFKEN